MAESDSDNESISSEEEELDLPEETVKDKYKCAAEIANRALKTVVKEIAAQKTALELCKLGDKTITEATSKVYNNKKGLQKGIAFPTCVSVNNCVGHYSPNEGEEKQIVLQVGDVVKVDLGAHIDGFIAVAAFTTIVTDNPQKPYEGRAADVICAAHYAAECAHRLIKPGNKNTQITEMIAKVAKQFECQPMEGVLSHRMRRHVIDGNEVIINKQSLEHKVEQFTFEENEVYAVDIVMSTGEGKSKEEETKTNIYKRNLDQSYHLKTKTGQTVLREIKKNFPTMPFNTRNLETKNSNLGIKEALNHQIISPYPVLYEKQGELVAQIKFTVMITHNETSRLTSHPPAYVSSQHEITDKEIKQTLLLGTRRNKKTKKKAKKPTDPEKGQKEEKEEETKEEMDTEE